MVIVIEEEKEEIGFIDFFGIWGQAQDIVKKLGEAVAIVPNFASNLTSVVWGYLTGGTKYLEEQREKYRKKTQNFLKWYKKVYKAKYPDPRLEAERKKLVKKYWGYYSLLTHPAIKPGIEWILGVKVEEIGTPLPIIPIIVAIAILIGVSALLVKAVAELRKSWNEAEQIKITKRQMKPIENRLNEIENKELPEAIRKGDKEKIEELKRERNDLLNRLGKLREKMKPEPIKKDPFESAAGFISTLTGWEVKPEYIRWALIAGGGLIVLGIGLKLFRFVFGNPYYYNPYGDIGWEMMNY